MNKDVTEPSPHPQPNLSPEDEAEFRDYVSDLSDIAPADLARYRDGFARAYERAALIRAGLLDPMSR